MDGKHYAIFGALLIAIALQLAGLEHWVDATNPKFVSGLLLTIGTTIAGVFSPKPTSSSGPLDSVTKTSK